MIDDNLPLLKIWLELHSNNVTCLMTSCRAKRCGKIFYTTDFKININESTVSGLRSPKLFHGTTMKRKEHRHGMCEQVVLSQEQYSLLLD